jgi:hypothetical protein
MPIKKYMKILSSKKNIINHLLLLNNLSIELKNNSMGILLILPKVANLDLIKLKMTKISILNITMIPINKTIGNP